MVPPAGRRREGARRPSANGPPFPALPPSLLLSVPGWDPRPSRSRLFKGEGFLPALGSAASGVGGLVAGRATSPAMTGAGDRRALVCDTSQTIRKMGHLLFVKLQTPQQSKRWMVTSWDGEQDSMVRSLLQPVLI
ncbi:uncharacterized protein ACIBXB_010342 isoform 1-T1 [Morphnus guianensis]